jgi:hypothetical protein
MKVLALAFLLTALVDPSLLAPGPQELRARITTMRAHLDEADTAGRAAARIHNQLAEEPASCANETTRSLLAQSRIAGRAYRDAVQAARADGARLRRLLAEPTIEPILDREQRERAEGLLARVGDHERRFGELAAWQARFAEPMIARCKPPLAP